MLRKILFYIVLEAFLAIEAKKFSRGNIKYIRNYFNDPNSVLIPNYDFSYSIYNDRTGNVQSHEVTRNKDEVQGTYTLIDADGFKRIVEYRANDREGFVARVRREPSNFHTPTTYKNFASQALVPSRAFYNVAYRSPNTNYKYMH